MAISRFNDQLTGYFMVANGNDVFIDPAQEIRFVSAMKWTTTSKRDTVSFGSSVGRGKFNTSRPFNAPTTASAVEPAGRNNENVFHILYTHAFGYKLGYALEALYGYQTNVPANVPGGIVDLRNRPMNAQWYSFANYLTYQMSDQMGALFRLEFFNDLNGQRTGFEGWYVSSTLGLTVEVTESIFLRPEIRYDFNDKSNAFGGNRSLLMLSNAFVIVW
ncbi:MAG: outer membrane beta-barrel protein [Zavarzinella sp.]